MLEKNHEEQDLNKSNSRAEQEALKKDSSVFSVIQNIIGNKNSFHMPVVVNKTIDEKTTHPELTMSRSPSF